MKLSHLSLVNGIQMDELYRPEVLPDKLRGMVNMLDNPINDRPVMQEILRTLRKTADVLEELQAQLTQVTVERDAVINESTTIDPIHAVGGCYCRECVHWCVSMDKLSTWCSVSGNKETVEDDFCSYGKIN